MGKIILPITIAMLQLVPSVPVADYKPTIYIVSPCANVLNKWRNVTPH
jgi:hypothetical protein